MGFSQYSMKAVNGRPSRKRAAPAKSVLVERRAPRQDEIEAGAEQAFDRRGPDGVIHTVLVRDSGDFYAQFGAPIWVMTENNADAAAWHREIRQVRFNAFGEERARRTF